MSPLGGNDSFGSCASGTILPKGENGDFGGGLTIDNDNDDAVDYSDDITMMMMMLSQRMMVGQ